MIYHTDYILPYYILQTLMILRVEVPGLSYPPDCNRIMLEFIVALAVYAPLIIMPRKM